MLHSGIIWYIFSSSYVAKFNCPLHLYKTYEVESNCMKVAIGNDHAGLELKQKLVTHIENKGHTVIDMGTGNKERTHSALYADKVTKLVKLKRVDMGILICGTGVGMNICANKVNGIRAVMGFESHTVEQARRHNDTNVLTLGALTIEPTLAIKLVDMWLETEFDDSETRRYRLHLIEKIEIDQNESDI